jgi:ring-1,2-phenylacetyl-CoA epoxidase subunit PaaE
MNFSLEDDEVKKGYILTCQAHPTSEEVFVDFDIK